MQTKKYRIHCQSLIISYQGSHLGDGMRVCRHKLKTEQSKVTIEMPLTDSRHTHAVGMPLPNSTRR